MIDGNPSKQGNGTINPPPPPLQPPHDHHYHHYELYYNLGAVSK